MKIILTMLFAGAAVALAGCGDREALRSVVGSECKIFERPEYAVEGRTRYDQRWIDRQVEGGVGGCSWPRPAARPPELAAQPAVRAAPAPVKRPGFVKRIKAKLTRAPVAPPAPKAVDVQPAPEIAPQPAMAVPATPPCSRVDELLNRCGPRRVY